MIWASVRAKLLGGQVRRSADSNDPRKWPMEVSVLELILHRLTFLTNGVNVTQVLAAARAGYSQGTLGNSPRTVFLINLFVGTYRLSSHARLEAFVIQTKPNYYAQYK
jgi:hypothetical protein